MNIGSALNIGAVPGITPNKWLQRFNEAYPKRGIQADFFDSHVAEQLQRIRAGRIDVGFIRLAEEEWSSIDTDVFHRVWLYTEDVVVCVSNDHWLAAADGTVSWADIADEPTFSGYSAAELQAVSDDAAVSEPVTGTQLAHREREALDIVATGVGVAVMPASVARMLSRKDIIALTVADDPGLRVGIAWLRSKDSAEIQDFVGITRGRRKDSSRGS